MKLFRKKKHLYIVYYAFKGKERFMGTYISEFYGKVTGEIIDKIYFKIKKEKKHDEVIILNWKELKG